MDPSNDLLRRVNPVMVTLARESRGLNQTQLATELGITQGRLSKIESGVLTIPEDLLNRISHMLGYPKHFFQRSGERVGVGVAELFHRKQQGVSTRVLARIHAIIEIRSVLHFPALLRSVEISSSIPELDIEEYDCNAGRIADLVRATLELPRGPIHQLVNVIEDAGGIVVPFDFETRQIDAISRWVPGLPPLFFLNSAIPTDRARWSLAHELGHMVMHKLPSPEIEHQANEFAAEFLVPERDVRSDLSDLTLPKLANLKRYWKVSMQALLKRAEALGTVTPNRARYLWSQIGNAGYRRREPVELDLPAERPELVHELFEVHRRDLGYSIADLCEMLAVREDDLFTWYCQADAGSPLRLVNAVNQVVGPGTA
ncbi:MAG: ImmA/IrrE family metallo-endopeptidase [Chloroflexota bacterium]